MALYIEFPVAVVNLNPSCSLIPQFVLNYTFRAYRNQDEFLVLLGEESYKNQILVKGYILQRTKIILLEPIH